jgi:hypothetical protein
MREVTDQVLTKFQVHKRRLGAVGSVQQQLRAAGANVTMTSLDEMAIDALAAGRLEHVYDDSKRSFPLPLLEGGGRGVEQRKPLFGYQFRSP